MPLAFLWLPLCGTKLASFLWNQPPHTLRTPIFGIPSAMQLQALISNSLFRCTCENMCYICRLSIDKRLHMPCSDVLKGEDMGNTQYHEKSLNRRYYDKIRQKWWQSCPMILPHIRIWMQLGAREIAFLNRQHQQAWHCRTALQWYEWFSKHVPLPTPHKYFRSNLQYIDFLPWNIQFPGINFTKQYPHNI